LQTFSLHFAIIFVPELLDQLQLLTRFSFASLPLPRVIDYDADSDACIKLKGLSKSLGPDVIPKFIVKKGTCQLLDQGFS
jgi:hypothetical protein